MPGTSPYPWGAPVVSGTQITVETFLKTPPRVQRAIEAMTTQRFIANVIFGGGPQADGGAVVYDQVTQANLFLARDVQEIEPGATFPVLNDTELAPLVAIAKKYGGEVYLTDEAVRRDNRDKLGREMTRLRNTITRKVDTVAMAALRTAPINSMPASADWSTSTTDIIGDLATAIEMITGPDMGYDHPDTAFINPAQETDLLKKKDIREALPRERSDVPIATGRLGRLMGLDFVVTNRVNAGEIIICQRGIVGGISDEVPLYARPIPEPRSEVTFIHGARVVTPYVTDPKAVVRIHDA